MRTLKVLLIAPQPFFQDRGTPIAVRMAAEAIGADGHQVDLLTLPFGRDITIPNVRVHRVSAVPRLRQVPIGPSWPKLVYDVRIVAKARRMLRNGEYDVVHGVEEGALMAWHLSRGGRRIPFVYDMDSHLSAQLTEKGGGYALASGVFRWMEKAALRDALGVLAVSPALADVARKYRGGEGVTDLPDTPLDEEGDPAPDPDVAALPGPRIGYVGNLESYQGIDLLIAAVRTVARTHPGAHLVVVGGSPDRIGEYRSRVEQDPGGGKVTFLGPRPLPDLGSILAAMDVLVSPRLKGVNTPMKIYSYLASGKPVVATRLPTHTQVLSDSVACLVDPEPELMAEAIASLLESPEAAAALGRQGRAFVLAEYGVARFRERITRFYRDISDSIHRKGRGHPGRGPDPGERRLERGAG